MYTIAFDTETKGLDWFDPDQQAFMLSWADEAGGHAYELGDDDSHSEFLSALDRAEQVVCHNLAFDAHQLRETWGVDILDGSFQLHDTDLMSRVVMPFGQRKDRGGHGLKNLGKILVDPSAADSEDTMKELAEAAGIKLKTTGGYYEFYRAYPRELTDYAIQDAVLTLQLFDKLYAMLDERSSVCYALEMAVAPVLIRAEQRGIALDSNAVDELYTKYKAELKQLRLDLHDRLGEDLVLDGKGSEESLLESLQMIGVPLYRKTASGKLSTSKFALQEFEDEFPEIATLMEYRRVAKFLSTYIGPMRGRDVVHTSFRQCEAWTGRMSSARPNLQNLPKRAGREVRRPLVARPGNTLVACDFDGIEARLLAYYMNDENYKQFFRDDSDPHAWMAAQIHGGEPSAYEKGTEGEELRNAAKNTLFAITYGAGAPRVADMNKISKTQAQELISKIKTSLPKYRKLMGRIRKKVQYQGYVSTLMGRKQMINKEKAYVGLNALIQGTAADIMKQAVVNINDEFAGDGDVHLLLVVHDEAVVECPKTGAEIVMDRVCHAMQRAGNDIDPPLAVSGSIGNTYEEV